MGMYYFDNAATTPMSRSAMEKYTETALEYVGNPSSIHREGVKAHDFLEEQRSTMERLLGVDKGTITFTSGATESIALVFQSLLWARTPGRIIVSRIEHSAVLSWLPILKDKGWDIVKLKAKNGEVSKEDLRDALTPDTKLVAVMKVNNVTGAVQDIKGLVEVVREYEKETRKKIFFFSDSVQALGKTDLDLKGDGVDGASFSSHKVKGPRGIGMLYLRNTNFIHPLAPAGGQERGIRGGTENLPAIAAFTQAVKDVYEGREEKERRVREISSFIKEEVRKMGFTVLSGENATPYIISISGHLPSEVFTRMLIDRGFCISSGSACSNNAKQKGEPVLQAMGWSPEIAGKAVRISLADDTDRESAEKLIEAIRETI